MLMLHQGEEKRGGGQEEQSKRNFPQDSLYRGATNGHYHLHAQIAARVREYFGTTHGNTRKRRTRGGGGGFLFFARAINDCFPLGISVPRPS